MLNLTPSMNYYLYPYPADMRRGFYSLSGLVHDVMGMDSKHSVNHVFFRATSHVIFACPKCVSLGWRLFFYFTNTGVHPVSQTFGHD